MFYKELEKDRLTCWNLKHYRKLCCKDVCCRQKQTFITVFVYQVQVYIFHLFLSFVLIVHQVVCSGIGLCRPPFDSKRCSDSDQREEVPRKRSVVSQHFIDRLFRKTFIYLFFSSESLDILNFILAITV